MISARNQSQIKLGLFKLFLSKRLCQFQKEGFLCLVYETDPMTAF